MFRFVPLYLTAVLLLASCKRSPQSSSVSAQSEQSTNQQVFQVKGVIKAVRPGQKEIEITHEAIPGYMPAMTMPFDVKNPNELIGLQPGQAISFRLTATDTDGWVDNIRVLGTNAGVTTSIPTNPPVHVVQPLQTGEPLPEYHLTNQLGQVITTTQFKGRALAITFLFTRCPFPTFCPRLANDFAETQQKLLALEVVRRIGIC